MKRTLYLLTICLLLTLSANAQYIIHIAGNDSVGYYGDGGPALHASLRTPYSICRDAAGNLYIGDGVLGNSTAHCYHIRKIDAATGIITTIAGTFSNPASADSADVIAATSARFSGILALCVDNQGNLLIADGYTRIRKLNFATGMVTTVAGSAIYQGYTGDGGPATAARLRYPCDVTVDKNNNIYIVEQANFVVRKIDGITGIITTVAGTGSSGGGGG